MWKDLEDCYYSDNNIGFDLLKSELLILLIDAIYFVKNLYPPKPKWALKSLAQVDSEFLDILNRKTENNLEELLQFRKASSHVEKLLGGSRGLPWSLRSELSL